MFRFASFPQARMWVLLKADGDCCALVNWSPWAKTTPQTDHRMQYTLVDGRITETEML